VPIQRLKADIALDKYYFHGMKLSHHYLFIAAAGLLSSCAQKPGVSPEQLAALGNSCQAQMIATTCQAMKPSTGTLPNPGEVVFVAGVGPVDAQLLAKLSAAGQTMCEEVKATCSSDWTGSACTALKKMYAPALFNK
jgi:hypothetical protein